MQKGGDGVTTKQIQFLGELLRCGNIAEAVSNTGVALSTAYRWMKNDDFREELQKRKSQLLDEVVLQMQVNFSGAVAQLTGIINNADTAPQVKINAIDCLFRNARPLIEDVEILNRLQGLEDAMERR